MTLLVIAACISNVDLASRVSVRRGDYWVSAPTHQSEGGEDGWSIAVLAARLSPPTIRVYFYRCPVPGADCHPKLPLQHPGVPAESR